MGCEIPSNKSRGWHAIRKYQGTRRRQRTLTGQGWGQRPPCRCRESRALGSVGFPACRTLRTPGDCRAVEASLERGCRVRLPACTTGSSVWKSTPAKGLSQVRLLPILPAFGPAIEDGRKTTRRTRGDGSRVAPQPEAAAPSAVAVCASTRHGPRPQPAQAKAPRGRRHGALQGPSRVSWDHCPAVTAPMQVRCGDHKTLKKERTRVDTC